MMPNVLPVTSLRAISASISSIDRTGTETFKGLHLCLYKIVIRWERQIGSTSLRASKRIRDLLAREPDDVRAAEAVALFCYQAKKWIGSFAAALGGLDTLVFAGGIGENAALIRERICDGLGFLGIELDSKRNAKNAGLISVDGGLVAVRVIRTDEEVMIARSVVRVFGLDEGKTDER